MKPVFTNLEDAPRPQPLNAHENTAHDQDAPHQAIHNEDAREEMPLWMRRIFLIIYVLFCIEVGIILVALPWTERWETLLMHWPSFRHVLGHGFVRGAVSGLGFVDLWFAIAEAVNYRERR